MESVIKGFLGLFFTVLISAVGVGILSASIDARAAEEQLGRYCREIENSNFSEKVIEACCRDAKDADRLLSVNIGKRPGEDVYSYGTCALTYELRIPVIGIKRRMTVTSPLR